MKYRLLAALAAGLFCAPAGANVAIDFENQQIPAGWAKPASAEASWAVASDQAYAGGYSLRSEPIAYGQTAAIEWTGTFEASTLSFMLRYDNGSGCCEDFQFAIDGVVVEAFSGNDRDWEEVRETLTAGQHTLRWIFRNGSIDSAVWIDNVRVGASLSVVEPLMQVPGALIVSAQGALIELRHDSADEIVHEAPHEGALAISPAGGLYIADMSPARVLRYEAATHNFANLAVGVLLGTFDALDDRLIGGQSGNCGGYTTVSYATGSVFNSASATPCGMSWDAAVRRGPDLWVMQQDTLTRRSAAVPDAQLTTFSIPRWGRALAIDRDGTFWQLSNGNELYHLAGDGSQIAHYVLPSYYFELAVREDGLLALTGGQHVAFARPDHGYRLTRDVSDGSLEDLIFVPGAAPDQDGDGLPLWWEQAYGTDPAQPADAANDGDGDGLSNAQEYAYTSNPTLIDTDGDGASDIAEYVNGANPHEVDTDGDGLTDGFEILDLHSDPADIDSDGDGMGDYYEYTNAIDPLVDDRDVDTDGDGLTNLQEFQLGTRPALADSDSDGLGDGTELNTHGTLPLDSDSDNDGLNDGAEVTQHFTDPLDADSDDDGLNDKVEVTTLHSNPNHADSDGDGMPDAWEHTHGLDLLVIDASADPDGDGLTNVAEHGAGSNPREADSDGDLLDDGDELAHGADPLDKDSDGDRLPDGWEVAFSFDPVLADSQGDGDGDGFTTLEEFWWGSSVAAAGAFPLPQLWGTLQGDQRHRGYQPLKLTLPAAATPVLTVPLASMPHPAVQGAGTIFYVQSDFAAQNLLVAIDAQTGQERWRKEFEDVHDLSPPAFADGRVYVQTAHANVNGGRLHAYDAVTGALLFEAPVASHWESFLAPTVFGDSVYVNGGGGTYALHRVSGSQRWFTALPHYYLWAPAVDDAYVYAYLGGQLEMLDRNTGNRVAAIDDPGHASGGNSLDMAPVLGGYDNVLVCHDNRMASYDLVRRAVAWSKNGCASRQPVVANGLAFLYSGSMLTALEEVDGATAWTRSFPANLEHNIVATRGHLIVSSAEATYFLRLSDRSLVQTLPVAGPKVLTEDGRLIISTASGLVVYDLTASGLGIFTDSFE